MLAIAAILVFVCFFKSAMKNGSKNVLAWAVFGVFAFYVTGSIWVYWFLKPAIGKSFYSLSPFQGVLVELSGIAIALLVVYAIYRKLLVSKEN